MPRRRHPAGAPAIACFSRCGRAMRCAWRWRPASARCSRRGPGGRSGPTSGTSRSSSSGRCPPRAWRPRVRRRLRCVRPPCEIVFDARRVLAPPGGALPGRARAAAAARGAGAAQLRAALAARGFEPESRPFRAHLTLARKVVHAVGARCGSSPLRWPVAGLRAGRVRDRPHRVGVHTARYLAARG